ncbi:MAG: DNA polymerase III subunit beta [Mucinivorans sp.]
MKFTVSSSALSQNLQAIGKVINSKNTIPILDYFLFEVNDNALKITASDVDTTLCVTIAIENQAATDGSVAVPARRILDSIKEFAEQPLTISVDVESWEIIVAWGTGKLTIPGITGIGYPTQQPLNDDELTRISIPAGLLADGIASTIFATADDTLRPVMNGVNIAISPTEITFVATDAHRLVRYQNTSITSPEPAAFILPAKSSSLLRSVMPRDEKVMIQVEFDSKNVIFTLPNHRLVGRLIEGNYPNYNAVIPLNNTNNLSLDRGELMASLRRVSVCSNQASGLVRLNLSSKGLAITAQDFDYNTSAEDNIACIYAGEPMEIGFKAPFLLDILNNIHTTEVMISLADSSRPGLFLPVDPDDQQTTILMLLMPMMINA